MTRTQAQRSLDAEIRAVEGHHQARLAGDGRTMLVKSDSDPTRDFRVEAKVAGRTVWFSCSHPVDLGFAEQPLVSVAYAACRHVATVARRMERAGLLRWEDGAWHPTEKAVAAAHATTVAEDGTRWWCSCGTGANIASLRPGYAQEQAERHLRSVVRTVEDVFEGLGG